MSAHEARNAAICEQYTEKGLTLQAIGALHGISQERVRQILRSKGVLRTDRKQKRTSRDKFVGVEVSATTKEALKREAEKSGGEESMSSLGAQAINDLLLKRGYPLVK